MGLTEECLWERTIGFTFLAMGFTGKVAAKFKEDYINAFNAMEAKLREIEQKALKLKRCPTHVLAGLKYTLSRFLKKFL